MAAKKKIKRATGEARISKEEWANIVRLITKLKSSKKVSSNKEAVKLLQTSSTLPTGLRKKLVKYSLPSILVKLSNPGFKPGGSVKASLPKHKVVKVAKATKIATRDPRTKKTLLEISKAFKMLARSL